MKLLSSLILLGTFMALNIASVANPLLEKFNTPFSVPPFDKIKPEHFVPALKVAMDKHNQEISAIVKNTAKPTFQNTVEALEYSGELLNDISTIFSNLNGANTNSELQKIAREVMPMLSAHYNNISLNSELFARISEVHKLESNKLAGEQKRLLDKTFDSFKKNGALLDDSKKAKLREISEKLSLLTLKFGENVLAETNSFKLVIDNKADLAGLPESVIAGAADDAKNASLEGKWLFTLQNPSLMPFLQYSSKRELREKIYKAYINRCDNNNEYDNKEIIKEIVNLKIERAKLFGYPSHAAYVLEDNMAKNPEKVYELLNQLWKPSLASAKKEAVALQQLINKSGENIKLEGWDWRYYSEILRKEQYDLDEEEIRSYFALDNVKAGIFLLVNKLFGLTFKEDKTIPVYHPDATAYQVFDFDNSFIGILYLDMHPRQSKRGGAWMTSYREQHYKGTEKVFPVVSLVCNFSKPAGDMPSLLTYDEAETFFHEFGHGLHGLLSNCTYKTLAGTSVPRDFVELPSQIMEHWLGEPELLKLFATHYKTGKTIPQELITKLDNSSKFNQGFVTTEFLAAALLDMSYHSLKSPMTIGAGEFEDKELKAIGLIPEITVRYRSTYFRHIFAGGYDAGYYSYIWSGVLDADAFAAFKEKGIFDKNTATLFRKNVLEKGFTEDPMDLYIKFRGKEPSIEALLIKRGLK